MLLIAMSLLIFGAVTMAAIAFHAATAAQRDPLAVRLRELRGQHVSSTTASFTRRPPLLLKLIAHLGGFMPAKDGTDAMRTGLVRAGFRRADAPVLFMGSKVLLAATLPVAWMVIGYSTGKPAGNVAMVSFILGFVGFYLPTFWIGMVQRQRHSEIVSALPDALDLMVVCVEAGLGMAAALQRVGGEIRLASRPLSDELGLVHREMQTGVSRTDALRNLAERTGVDDIYALVAMLIQTDRLGTGVAQSLRAHAESMRIRRRQRAEQMARKASIKLAFPLVFLIFPALLVIILGPAAVQLVRALAAGE
ncbi:MAG TPA: type II secretion system F family protein [Candidatus Limnocylindria bacterium]|nr:type II secretion system F family protein [Candidatus Limnocylindria bacterium]